MFRVRARDRPACRNVSIVNNALNQLQCLRLEAEGHVHDASLTLFDEVIHETAAKLNALGDLEAYTEKQMATGSGLDTGSSG